MKKLILFLLLPLWMVAQTSSGMEQEFDYGIKNNSTQTITTPPYLTTTGIDGTQGKIPASLIALKSDLPVSYTKVVYVNTTSPSTATIFDDVNPPVINDNLLKSDAANLYIGTDASTWVWNSSSYVTKVVPDISNFWIYPFENDIPAGNNKNEPIVRKGDIFSDGNITAGLSLRSDNVQTNAVNVAFETPNTIASFDAGKQLRSLPTDTYPSLTELSYAKGVTSGIQAQINGKADLDGSGKVPLSQINDALLGSVNYKGTYNATTNVPAIPTATSSNKGWYYIISTAGTQQGFNFVNGDWIISNGTSWGKVDNNNTVTSVNGQVGAVSVTASSIGAQTTLTNPVTGVGSQNDPSTYALQDGTILYHSTKWFVPTGTVSTSGATVTSVGTQFTSGMVGAKLIINGEWRIITAFTSSTVVTVASAYSQDYSGVVAGSWGVYSKAYVSSEGTYTNVFKNSQSKNVYLTDGNSNAAFESLFTNFIGTLEIGKSRIDTNGLDLASANNIRWSNNAGNEQTTKDLGLRRNTAGVLEIYDGVTADGAIGNRRDLLARNYTGSATLTGTPTAPTAPVGTNTTQIATTAFVTGGLATKENAFSKNTAFNKNFGTTAGTVAEGNDSRILNGQTAFGWGNHSGLYPTLTGGGATGTWGINISGNSSSATSWGGRTADLGDLNTGMDLLVSRGLDGVFRLSQPPQVQSFLGLGSNAYNSTAYLPLSGGSLSGVVNFNQNATFNANALFNGSLFTDNVKPNTGNTLTLLGGGANNLQVNGAATFSSTVTASPATLDTQLATLGQVKGTRSYKVYTALLTQTGTSAPTATVLENTLGGTVVWSRTGTGQYSGVLTGAFTNLKTAVFCGSSKNATSITRIIRFDINTVYIYTTNASGTYIDTDLVDSTFEIRVYP